MLARLSKCMPQTPRGTPSRRKRIMRRAKIAVRPSSSSAAGSVNDSGATKKRIGNQRSDEGPMAGLRERKKARLRQQIVETALHLFRRRRRSEEHTSELQSHLNLVCRLLL